MAESFRRALVAGTGKLGRNIGLMLLRAGWQVTWLTRLPTRLESARSEIGRQVRRLRLDASDLAVSDRWSVTLLSESPALCNLIIESSSENRDEKLAIAQILADIGDAKTLRLSNSSSILPSEIGIGWIGCHFFYPVELNGIVELIFTGPRENSRLPEVQKLLQQLGFHCIVQDEKKAFAVNRLLLPLQAEAMACMMAGHGAAEVEAASHTTLFPAGMLSTMDGIGLELVLSAVRNYSRRMEPGQQAQIAPLLIGLEILVQAGFTGASGKGLLGSSAFPWSGRAETGKRILSPAIFENLARESVRQMVLSRQISRDDCCLVIREFWNSQADPLPGEEDL